MKMTGHRHNSIGRLFARAAIAALFLLAALPAHAGEREIGVVTAAHLKLLPRADLEAAPLATLAKGARVDIIERLDIWMKVSHNSKIGFIRYNKKNIKIEPAPPSGKTGVSKTKAASKANASPKTGKKGKMDALREEAGDIERKVEEHKAAVREISKREKEIINRLDAVDLMLHDARTRVFEVRSKLADCRKSVKDIQEKIDDLKQQIRGNESHVSRRLVVLYKLSNLGAAQIFATADSVYELMKRKTAISAILSQDEKKRKQLINAKKEFMELVDALRDRETRMNSLEVEYKERIQTASIEKKTRKELLSKIRDEKALEKALILSLKSSAEALDEAMAELEREAERAKKAREKKKAEEARKAEKARKKQLAKKNTKAKKNGKTKNSKKEARPETDPGKAFAKLKGLLTMPVKGKITGLFGPYKNPRFNTVNYRGGIDIKADRGEPVRAVSSGKVLYSRWFKGYGNLVIIDHGASYYTLYAHLEEVFKEKGDPVESGEVIATVGDTGSIHGPKLHFQVRRHGEPMDPLKWVRRG